MRTIQIKEARNQLRAVLDRVAAGEVVILMRRQKEVARLIPPKRTKRALPSLARVRRSIHLKGTAMSSEVVKARHEERA